MPTPDGSWSGTIGILSVLLLVFANGFFVASEFPLLQFGVVEWPNS
jgi:hypothetical protein